MLRRSSLALLMVIAPVGASATCSDEVAAAYARANALPPTAGRAALLEQILRAEVAHHEGDEEGCAKAVGQATEVLDTVEAAHAKEPK